MSAPGDVFNMVVENIKSALENGYDLEGMTDEELAVDLLDCAADLEDIAFVEVLLAVKCWRAEQIVGEK